MSAELPEPPESAADLIAPGGFRKVVAIWLIALGLRTLKVRIVVPSGAAQLSAGKTSITGSGRDLTLLLPLLFPQGYAAPTGTPSRATFNADLAFTVSSPPTQAEVVAIKNALIATRQTLAAVIVDGQATGMIGKIG